MQLDNLDILLFLVHISVRWHKQCLTTKLLLYLQSLQIINNKCHVIADYYEKFVRVTAIMKNTPI